MLKRRAPAEETAAMQPSDHRPLIRVLTGCTAVGKTELALDWAERSGAEIVSCDSLLFYQGMDIGTAKPGPAELARVPHHLVDCNALTDQMDITRYVAQARSCIEALHARGKPVLVTGGSGFYLKAFFGPVADDLVVPEALRNEVRRLSTSEALARLRSLNPEGLGRLDVDNPVRVHRALERCLASGSTLLELARAFAAQKGPFDHCEVRLLRLERPQEELEARVLRRVEAMLEAGLVNEVRALDAIGLRKNPSAARAIGYREVLAFLDGDLAEAELVPRIAADTRALVKKQRTWFRTQLPPHAALPASGLARLPW